ncbi:MAG: gamma-glutamyltransferase [Gammaproteobacteria bacterium]
MTHRRVLLVVFLVFAIGNADAKSVLAPSEAAIASAHPLATAAGHEILEAGGNAFDAAVAVSAALAVVEPYSSGLGGGGFYLLHLSRVERDVFVDARERAPLAATKDMFLDREGQPDYARMREGALAAGIPGTPAALAHLAREYGELPLARSLAPAIRLAHEGFEVDPRFAALTSGNAEKLRRYGTTAFFIDGAPPKAGDRLRLPELAATLEALARDGGESFYRGAIAEKLVDGVREAGGLWTPEDLSSYQVIEREPLVGRFRGHRIVTAPPPSSGGTVLLGTLNILAGYETARLDEATRTHLLIEAWRRAYRDRGQYLGDPAFVDVPVARLLDADYAAGLRAGIRLDRATPSETLPSVTMNEQGDHTTHFSILDRSGNRVAATQTVNFRYGAGLMPAGTGVVLNNEMFDFAPKAGAPDGFELVSAAANLVAPGKRPVSSMTPTFVEGPDGLLILGTPGGSRIITMVTLGILGWLDGLDAAGVAARPRFHHQFLPDVIDYEPDALDPALRRVLADRGHALRESPRRYGNMNVVTWRYRGNVVEAATDPRNESVVDF